jgi:hypothetical protein
MIAMDRSAGRIAVVQGAPSTAVQALFRDLVARWHPPLRIAGLIEERDGPKEGRTCRAGDLRSVVDGTRYPMFEQLPPGATACDVTDEKVTRACAAALQDIATGADLVILSKFGKLEAEGGGLMAAFRTAAAAGIPVLTCASPAACKGWDGLAAPSAIVLPAEAGALDRWLAAVLGHGRIPASTAKPPGEDRAARL